MAATKPLKVAFDTSAWRAMGLKGCAELRAHLAANKGAAASIEIWETVPAIFETAWDWIKDKKPYMASLMAAEKIEICGGRIVPSPRLVIQRAIADHFKLTRPDIQEEVRLFQGLLAKMKDLEFIKSEEFSKALINSVRTARQQYKTALEELANAMAEVAGKDRRTPGIVERLFEEAEVRSLVAPGLAARFDLPDAMKTHMALFSAWEEVEHTRRVVEFYKARISALVERDVVPKDSDFLDFEIMICGTRLDRLVTVNTKDFQRYDLPSLQGKLWTLAEFKKFLKWADGEQRSN